MIEYRLAGPDVLYEENGFPATCQPGRWGGWDGRTAEMKVYDKWHKPPDDARLVDYVL